MKNKSLNSYISKFYFTSTRVVSQGVQKDIVSFLIVTYQDRFSFEFSNVLVQMTVCGLCVAFGLKNDVPVSITGVIAASQINRGSIEKRFDFLENIDLIHYS